MSSGPAHISASLLNVDHANLGAEVRRAVRGGVDSIHVDVMDGHFVEMISVGPAVQAAIRGDANGLPVHSHLMVSQPLRQIAAFAEAGSDMIVFHVEANDEPGGVIAAIAAAGCGAGLALNPETPPESVLPFLDRLQLLLVMSVHPGRGGQTFVPEVLRKIRFLRTQIERRGLRLPIGVDGGVNVDTIGAAHAAGGEVLVAGSALYREPGDLADTVRALRAAAAESA